MPIYQLFVPSSMYVTDWMFQFPYLVSKPWYSIIIIILVRFSSIFVWLIKNFILSISCFSQYFYLLNFICMDCVDFLLSFIYLFVLCFNSLKEFLGVMPAWEFWEAIKWMEVKLGKHWKPYGIGDTRAVGCLLRRAVVRGWDQPKR